MLSLVTSPDSHKKAPPNFVYPLRCIKWCVMQHYITSDYTTLTAWKSSLMLQQHRLPVRLITVIMWCFEPSYQHAVFCAQWANSAACFVLYGRQCVRVRTSCSFSVEDTGTQNTNNKSFKVSSVYLPAAWRKASARDGVGSDTAGREGRENSYESIKAIREIYYFISLKQSILLFFT